MFKKILLLSFLISCSAQYLNLNHKHYFRVQPQEIVWLQLADLKYETLDMVKNSTLIQENKFYNQFTCVGSLWTDSAASHHLQSLIQLSGNRYLDKLCPEIKMDYIWDYFKDERYDISLIDIGVKTSESFSSLKQCGEKFENTHLFQENNMNVLSTQVAQNKKTKKLTIIRDFETNNTANWEKKIMDILAWQAQKKTRLFVISSVSLKTSQNSITPVFASGASSENFCGMMSSHQLLERFITGMKYSLW